MKVDIYIYILCTFYVKKTLLFLTACNTEQTVSLSFKYFITRPQHITPDKDTIKKQINKVVKISTF